MPDLRASVIVRARNEEQSIAATLESLQTQTARAEIIVVDSGSTDETLRIARRAADRVVEIPSREFTYGRALNVGASAATGDVHFALSAHCPLPQADWIERSLEHYGDDRVAATNGMTQLPDGTWPDTPFRQDAAHARKHPTWGFSNHASSWRASVWEQFPFDETLPACEDKEWALRVLDSGWVIVFDRGLYVELSHRWRSGPRAYFRRCKNEYAALASFASLPPYGLSQCIREWWSNMPDDRHSKLAYRLHPTRIAGVVGHFVGQRSPHLSTTRGTTARTTAHAGEARYPE